jgi:formylmethanofuran dehydrogenase subunit C
MWARISLGVGTEGNLGNLFISAIVFSVVGIVGACLVVNSSHTKVAGWLMIIGAVGISAVAGAMGALTFFVSGILLIIAGLMSAFKNTKA